MIERITDADVWTALQNEERPIFLYGMGLGAEKILAEFEQHNIKAEGIFASDEFVRGHSFKGYLVQKYSDICAQYDDFCVVLCFATRLDNVLDNIRKINSRHTVYAPDVPVAGDGLFTREFVAQHDDEFEYIYNNLADEESKRVYLDVIRYKVSGKIGYLLDTFAEKDEIYSNILRLGDNENIIDLGAYDGDTVQEFIMATGNKYRHITALEPDPKNYKKLVRNVGELPNISCINMGVWDKKDTLIFSAQAGRNSRLSGTGNTVEVTDIDSLNIPATFIKMDVEGSELKALKGAENTIVTHSPKLYVCAYHRNEDLFVLPKTIWSFCKDYKIYFRHSKYIPAWESNFYCVI